MRTAIGTKQMLLLSAVVKEKTKDLIPLSAVSVIDGDAMDTS